MTRAAAVRELREETGIALDADRLIELGLRIEVADGASLVPFAVVDPPPPQRARASAALGAHECLGNERLMPAVARTVHKEY